MSGLGACSGEPPDLTLFEAAPLSRELAAGHEGAAPAPHIPEAAGCPPGVGLRPPSPGASLWMRRRPLPLSQEDPELGLGSARQGAGSGEGAWVHRTAGRASETEAGCGGSEGAPSPWRVGWRPRGGPGSARSGTAWRWPRWPSVRGLLLPVSQTAARKAPVPKRQPQLSGDTRGGSRF